MLHLRYLLVTLFYLHLVASSSLQSFIQVDKVNASEEWNPKWDPVFDPETNVCHFDVNPRYRFTPEQYLSVIESGKEFYPFPNNNKLDEPIESVSVISRFSPSSWDSDEGITSPYHRYASSNHSPSKRSTSKHSPSKQYSSSNYSSHPSYFASEDVLYVPDMCKRSERKWDFIIGDLFDMEPKIIGWVSNIGFAFKFIREMALPMKSASYTLIPHRLATKTEVLEILPTCEYFEIKCSSRGLFHNLSLIYPIIDSSLINSIVVINISYDINAMTSIKIVSKPGHEEFVFGELANVHCGVN